MSEPNKEPAKDTTGAGAGNQDGKGGGTALADPPKPDPKAGAEGAAAKDAKGGKPAGDQKPIELKLPEGSLLEDGAVERIKTLAKERGLSQQEAQELLEREHDAVATYVEGQKATLTKTMSAWADELKADKEIGGEGLPKNVELAKRVIEKFGSEALKNGLDESGFGNHPELVRIFVKIGKAMAADTWVNNNGGVPPPKKSMAEVFYGSGEEKKADGE